MSKYNRESFPDIAIVNIFYLIRTNFREALISRFSKNREIKDSRKKGYGKIKQAKFNAPIKLVIRDLFIVKVHSSHGYFILHFLHPNHTLFSSCTKHILYDL